MRCQVSMTIKAETPRENVRVIQSLHLRRDIRRSHQVTAVLDAVLGDLGVHGRREE